MDERTVLRLVSHWLNEANGLYPSREGQARKEVYVEVSRELVDAMLADMIAKEAALQ